MAPPPPLLMPLHAPPPPPPHPPHPQLFDYLTEALSAPRASAPTTTTTRRHHPMADADAVAGAAAVHHHQHQDVMLLRRTRSGRAFPPPISVIGKGGRPWLSLRAHREGGRLVLREMRLPSQELPLQPCREDGRFKLLIHPEAGRAPTRPCGAGAAALQERQGKDEQCS